MTTGTKSVLFGVHAVWLHWFFVAKAWIRLYGWTFDPRIWLSFIIHDIGYWGCENIDGAKGKLHPRRGALIMKWLFDKDTWWGQENGNYWYEFTAGHSRSFAKLEGIKVSKLCAADKLASALTPWWLYIPMATLSGEIIEYMVNAAQAPRNKVPENMWWGGATGDKGVWYDGMVDHMTYAAYKEAKDFQ